MESRVQKLQELIESKFDGRQADLARKAEISPSQLNQWLTGFRNIGEKAARSLESKLGLDPGWLDGAGSPPLFTEDTEGGYAVKLLAAAASMGAGAEQHDDVIVGRLTLSPTWISKSIKPLTKPEHLRFIHGYGDSMEPTFVDGDILLVDSGVNDVKVDGIYVLAANDRLYIKRVRQRMDGSFEISSDNATVKTVDVLDGSRPVQVLGRVVWAWNGKKL